MAGCAGRVDGRGDLGGGGIWALCAGLAWWDASVLVHVATISYSSFFSRGIFNPIHLSLNFLGGGVLVREFRRGGRCPRT